MRERKVIGGIVGSRFAARFHFDAMRRVTGADVEVAGVWSPTAANARAFAEARGIAAFADLDALLDAVEVVHV